MNNIYTGNIKKLHLTTFFFGIKLNVVKSFLVVYLLRLNATDFHISMYEIMSAIVTMASLIFVIPYLNNSKKTTMKSVFTERMAFLAFAISLFFIKKPFWIIIIYSMVLLTSAIASVLVPNYTKEAIPKERWGRVFSVNRIFMITTGILTLLFAGKLLDYFNDYFPYNFIVTFIIAAISFIIAYVYFRDIHANVKKHNVKATTLDRIKNIDKYLILIIIVNMPLVMTTPLWAIYHVKILGFNNFQVALLGISAMVGGIVSLPIMGRIIDGFPYKKLFIVFISMKILMPILYIFSFNFYYLLCVNVFLGIVGNSYYVTQQNILMEGSQKMKFDYIYFSNYQILLNINRLIFPAIGIFLYSQIGIINTFVLNGIFRTIMAIISYFVIRSEKLKQNRVELINEVQKPKQYV